MLSFFSEKKSPKIQEFNGLKFSISLDESQIKLISKNSLILHYRLAGKVELFFEKKNMSSRASLALIRLARKEEWKKQFLQQIQYVETEIKTGLGTHLLQRGRLRPLANILWPVLIRAFDVVIDEHTCISITTKCDFRDWPAVEKEISSIEASLTKTANHRSPY